MIVRPNTFNNDMTILTSSNKNQGDQSLNFQTNARAQLLSSTCSQLSSLPPDVTVWSNGIVSDIERDMESCEQVMSKNCTPSITLLLNHRSPKNSFLTHI